MKKLAKYLFFLSLDQIIKLKVLKLKFLPIKKFNIKIKILKKLILMYLKPNSIYNGKNHYYINKKHMINLKKI